MGDKQWIDMEVDKNKNGDEKSLLPLSNDSPADDSTPKINPVKWTVRISFLSKKNEKILTF